MTDDSKKFEAMYKKCRGASKDCTLKEAEKLAKRIKYFRVDALKFFEQLEEEIANFRRSDSDMKFEELKKEKNVNSAYKDIKVNQKKQLDAWNELEELEVTAAGSATCLKKLAAEIDKDLKKRPKTDKSKSDIEKLEKQIDEDLKESKEISALVNKVPELHREPAKELELLITKMMKSKPAESKYSKVASKMLAKTTLGNLVKLCTKAFKTLEQSMESAIMAAREGDPKGIATHYKEGNKQLQTITKLDKDYSKIKKSFQKDIDSSPDNKTIEDAIKHFSKTRDDADKLWKNALAEIKNASK